MAVQVWVEMHQTVAQLLVGLVEKKEGRWMAEVVRTLRACWAAPWVMMMGDDFGGWELVRSRC